MQFKTIAILAAITAPVTLAALLWPAAGGSIDTPEAGIRLLSAMQSGWANAAAITVTGPGGSVKLTRATGGAKPAEGWVLTDKFNYPVQAATLQPVLDGLRALRGLEPKTQRPKLYSRLGLEDPGKTAASHRVTITDAKGATLGSVILGREKSDATAGATARQYARVPEYPIAWLATPAIPLPDSALGWVDHGIVDLDASKVTRVSITQTGGETLDFKRTKPDDKLALQNPVPAGRKLKSDDPGAEIGAGLAALELNDVKPASAATGSPAATAHYELADGSAIDITLSRQDGQTWAVVTATGKTAAEINARVKGWAYALPDPRAATLTSKLDDLLEAPAKK